MMTITADEKENILLSLNMRLAFIETGDPVLRASDAERSGQRTRIRVLKTEQMRLIVQTEDLITKIRNMPVYS